MRRRALLLIGLLVLSLTAPIFYLSTPVWARVFSMDLPNWNMGVLDIQNLSEAPKLGFVRNRRIGQDIQLTLDVVSGTGGQRSENRGKT